MELIKNFGLDPILLSAQVINFLVVFYLLRRFLYKPMLSMLKKRQKLIEEGIAKATESQLLLEKASEKEKQLLQKAQETTKKLLDDARQQRKELMEQTKEMTKKQAEEMLVEAREQITRETKEAEKRLSTHISELAVFFLERSLKGILSEKEQNMVVKQAIVKMKKKTN